MTNSLAIGQIEAAKGTVPREAMIKAVNAFLASYATQDWQARASLLSADVIFEDTVGVPPPAIGREQAEAYFKEIIGYGITIEMTPERIVTMGNEAFGVTRARWTDKNSPEERLIIMHTFKFNDAGEISHVRIAYDEGCLEKS